MTEEEEEEKLIQAVTDSPIIYELALRKAVWGQLCTCNHRLACLPLAVGAVLSNLSEPFSGTPSWAVCTFVVDHHVVLWCSNNGDHCDSLAVTLRQQVLSARLMDCCFACACRFVYCCQKNAYGVCFGSTSRLLDGLLQC